ncbi:MAG: hypothetical protein FJ405_06090, partial [Verrucomicrobia bacterium]|nr:hypothetical protein [Verrucomicrobiota bacterium]
MPRLSRGADRLYRSFHLVKPPSTTGSGVTMVGLPRHPEIPPEISADSSAFPASTTKKGLQVQMTDDALALKIGHAALNVNLSGLLSMQQAPGTLVFESQGRRFHFHSAYLKGLDNQVKPLSDAGVTISLILLTYRSGDGALNSVLLHPAYDRACPNHLGAFNSVTAEGAAHLIACMEFLAMRYAIRGTPYGRVSNFIVGNEVNSHWFWSNRGRCSMEDFAEDYLRAVRMTHVAVRKASSTARVYVSLEHHWNIRYPGGEIGQSFPALPFLEYFQKRSR